MSDIRKEVFRLASAELEKNNVLLELATGVGKTKLALDLATDFKAKDVIVLVPTDAVGEAWDGEVAKWKSELNVATYNYKSAHKAVMLMPDMVILDECHHITPLNLESIRLFTCPMIGLSATVDQEKMALLATLGFKREISVSLDEAAEHDIVAPYEMVIIEFDMDNSVKNIPAGNKQNPFLQTEKASHDYANKRIAQAKHSRNSKSIEFAYLHRMRLIRNLPTRIKMAQSLMRKLREKYPESRMLVFAPDIERCEALTPDCFYHSKSDSSGFEAFKNGEKHTLGSVNALAEGINVHADMAIIVAGFSKERHTVQRLGRLLRKTAEGKMGKAFLLVAKDTQDETWAQNATDGLTNVKRYDAKSLGL